MTEVESKEQTGGALRITDILAKLISESENPEEPSSRVERKRRKTRGTIISATEQLMQSRPLHELTIAEITDAADVGHGTFYLHFKSKYEVVIPIIYQHTLEWDTKLQAAICDMTDPAEAVARVTAESRALGVGLPLTPYALKQLKNGKNSLAVIVNHGRRHVKFGFRLEGGLKDGSKVAK